MQGCSLGWDREALVPLEQWHGEACSGSLWPYPLQTHQHMYLKISPAAKDTNHRWHINRLSQEPAQISCNDCKCTWAASLVGGIVKALCFGLNALSVSQANPGSLIPGTCQSGPGMVKKAGERKRQGKVGKRTGYIYTAPHQERENGIYVWKEGVKHSHSQHLIKIIFFFPPPLLPKWFSWKCQLSIPFWGGILKSREVHLFVNKIIKPLYVWGYESQNKKSERKERFSEEGFFHCIYFFFLQI